MQNRFDKLEHKLDKISEDIAEIKIVQAEQAKDLKYHIRRTDLSEDRLEHIEAKILPILETKHKLDGAFKLIGIVASIVAFIVSVLQIFFGK